MICILMECLDQIEATLLQMNGKGQSERLAGLREGYDAPLWQHVNHRVTEIQTLKIQRGTYF